LQQVGAKLLDVVLDLRRRAFADGHHGDDGADADDDAENGQRRAQHIAADFAQREHDGVTEHYSTRTGSLT
jgi:hypothetical protein